MNKYQQYIRSKLTDRELLEQLAEEASELAQASLKLIRAEGMSNNPTPASDEKAYMNLVEEIHDVVVCYSLYQGFTGYTAFLDDEPKLERWAKRLGYKDE